MNSRNADPVAGRKMEWRSEMKRRLSQIISNDHHDFRAREMRIGAALKEVIGPRGGLWLAYSSTRHEPMLPGSIPQTTNVRYAFPRVDDASAFSMKFYVWDDVSVTVPESAWIAGSFGLREPNVNHASWRAVDTGSREVHGALIPGLGFDRRLRRLGRGAGFYDRFLKDSKFLKVGVGFSAQVADELPHEPHDIELDGLVTDREVIWSMSSSGVSSEGSKS